jgi:hypothetical protein
MAFEALSRILKRAITAISNTNHTQDESGLAEQSSAEPCKSPALDPITWDYSDQYPYIIAEGGHKPPPSFGSPTFIWHIGIWQKVQGDDSKLHAHAGAPPHNRSEISKRYLTHDEHNEVFFTEINNFILRLQHRGKILREAPEDVPEDRKNKLIESNIDKFAFTEYERRHAARLRQAAGLKVAHRFKDYHPQSLAFTLWWHDSLPDGSPITNTRTNSPAYSAIRVRVQVVSHLDHVTLSFFMDAGKPYGHRQIYTVPKSLPASDFGYRRSRIAAYLDRVGRISSGQIQQGFIEQDRLPEKGISPINSDILQDASTYFYDGIWRDFMKSFEINSNEAMAGRIVIGEAAPETESEGEIFMDHRGLVMSVPGVDTPLNKVRKQRSEKLREAAGIPQVHDERERNANIAMGPFSVFDHKSNEPNAVLKSYWPFIRRMVPWADYRDVIGCGITDWRSLYVNSLGATGSFYGDEESPSRQQEVPNFKEEAEGYLRARRPVTYLILTKNEPHREQIGRFVERINALGTSRLFALKNLRTIKNAGIHLRLLGAELDGVLEYWGNQRQHIEEEYERKLLLLSNQRRQKQKTSTTKKAFKWISKLWNGELPEIPAFHELQHIPSGDLQVLNDERVKKLGDLVKRVERRLVEIGSALDNIGNGGAGKILYVINRSKLHMDEFERLWPTLEVGDIPGWLNYSRFIQRSVLPTFHLIKITGERLVSFRQRLQSITEMIQTSALIIETEATRSNTEVLRRISSNIYFLGVPISLIFSALVFPPRQGSPFNLETALRLSMAIGAPLISYTLYRMKQQKLQKETEAERSSRLLDLQHLFRGWRRGNHEEPKN